jgi:hypothetical protein
VGRGKSHWRVDKVERNKQSEVRVKKTTRVKEEFRKTTTVKSSAAK